MDENYISRAEHEEFRRSMDAENKRLEDENDRQNHRLDTVKESIKQIDALSTSFEKPAVNMESMLREQLSHVKRLESLENRDGDMWRKSVSYAVTVIIGMVIGFVFRRLGM